MFEKKIFTQTHSNKAGNGFENSKGAYSTVFLITVTASICPRDVTSRGQMLEVTVIKNTIISAFGIFKSVYSNAFE